MNKKQKIALWVGASVIVLMGLVPPWTSRGWSRNGRGQGRHAGGYGLIFYPPGSAAGIDGTRLLVQWALAALVTGVVVATLKDKKEQS